MSRSKTKRKVKELKLQIQGDEREITAKYVLFLDWILGQGKKIAIKDVIGKIVTINK